MSITVQEMWDLKEFRQFQLIAGASGLDHKIESVGFLDYEYAFVNVEKPRKWSFRKNDLVITSLLFAVYNSDALMIAMQELCTNQVAAVCIKDVCMSKLPDEVIAYANEHSLPVFMFGRDDAYYEDIVVTIKNKITERSNLEQQEYQISLLLNGELEPRKAAALNLEILRNRVRPFRVLYCMYGETEHIQIRDYRIYYMKPFSDDDDHTAFYYKGGYFAIYYPDSIDAEEHNWKSRGLTRVREILRSMQRKGPDKYWTGISEWSEGTDGLVTAMKEAIAAQQYSRMHGQQIARFRDIGIYQVLLPHYHDNWFQKYSQGIVQSILDFDQQHDGTLYDTMTEYVKYYGNILKVSDAMHLHKNTIRYRINKVRELLGMEEDASFDMQIFTAFMVDELIRRL